MGNHFHDTQIPDVPGARSPTYETVHEDPRAVAYLVDGFASDLQEYAPNSRLLPAGLRSDRDGAISGRPTESGTFSSGMHVQQWGRALRPRVEPPPAPVWTIGFACFIFGMGAGVALYRLLSFAVRWFL